MQNDDLIPILQMNADKFTHLIFHVFIYYLPITAVGGTAHGSRGAG